MNDKDIQPSNGKTTIVDIAKASDVSPATVSLVLREKPGVSTATRQRVLETARSLGYIPPATAPRQSSQQDVKNIGLLMKVRTNESPETNQFYVPVVTGIESICRQRHSHLLYANLLVDQSNKPLELPRMLTDERIDGLLVVGMALDDSLLAHLKQRSLPIILVDGYAAGNPFDAVVTDNVLGAREGTEYLINQGHRHIAIVGSSEDAYPSIQERRKGYLQTMNRYGFPPIWGDCNLDPVKAAETALNLIDKHDELTAIFACNDETAIAIIKAIHLSGRRVPEDFSVIGFDNIVLSQHITPALTTMRVDKMSMGRLAAHLMFNRLDFPESAKVRTVIRPQLIVRESASPV